MSQELFFNLAPSFSTISSWEGAEVIKLMDNTYRDIQFAIANEFSLLIEGIGENSKKLFETANSGYKRTNIQRPGLVGGPCLEKDPHILIESAKNFNIDLPITSASRRINENMVNVGLKKVVETIKKKKINPKRISIFGLSFKGNPETSDIRGSLALPIINFFQRKYKNSQIIGFDKHVYKTDINDLNIELERDPYEASKNTDLIIIQHNSEYIKEIDISEVVNLMNNDGIIYDYWTLFESYRKNSKKNIDYLTYGNGK
jgi:UDP-N-acetyl-D-mannosaminuronic acid dehydrogenase